MLKREMPGLDALRGVAVLAVVFYHGLHWWLPPAISISPGVKYLSLLASPGWLGVNLFFVLSGFLITGILLDTRTHPNYWKSFYTRRALRILPLYLVTLLILRFYSGVSWMYFSSASSIWQTSPGPDLALVMARSGLSRWRSSSTWYGHLWCIACAPARWPSYVSEASFSPLCCDISLSAEFSLWETPILLHGW